MDIVANLIRSLSLFFCFLALPGETVTTLSVTIQKKMKITWNARNNNHFIIPVITVSVSVLAILLLVQKVRVYESLRRSQSDESFAPVASRTSATDI